MQPDNEKKIYFLLIVGVIVISTSGILISLSTAAPLIIAFYRMFFSVLVMTPFVLFRYKNQLGHFFNIKLVLVGAFLAVHFFLWNTAFEYTSIANAVIFIALQPLFTYLLEYFFAKEDLRTGIISGIIFALLGSIIISIGDMNTLFTKVWGDLLAIAAAFFAAAYLFTGRSIRRELEYLPFLYIIYTYACLFLGLMSLITRQSFSGFGNYNYLYFIGLALGPTLIGHSILNYSVRKVPATIVSLSILLEPVLTTVFAWILLGQGITWMTMVGGLLIIFGIYRAFTEL